MSKRIIAIGFIVLLLSGAAGSAFAYYLNKNAKKDLNASINSNDNKSKITPTATTTPTIKVTEEPALSPTKKVQTKELKVSTLKNLIYPVGEDNQNVKLINGNASFKLKYSEGNGTAVFEDQSLAIADMDNDGDQDAVFSIRTNYGGTGYFSNIFALIYNDVEPEIVRINAGLEDRDIIRSININGNIVTLNLTIHGPNDSSSTPTQNTIVKFKYENKKFIKQ